VHLGLIAVVVSEYDPAIAFFIAGNTWDLIGPRREMRSAL
jgi:hypothetical protein